MMIHPLISIIVPCYNQAQYLEECLDSVKKQTYLNWECIIVDDGSPDNTAGISTIICSDDSRFLYYRKENGGLSSARNFGISKAKGTYILALDADDKISYNYLELAINEFQKDSTLKVVYAYAEKFGEETGVWYLPPFDISKLGLYNMIFCTALFRKQDWELVGGFDAAMIYGLEDWEFWIAILKNGGKVKQIDAIGFFYRIKNNSMLKQLTKEQKESMYNYLSTKHADFYVKHQGSFITLNAEIEKLKKMRIIKGRKKVLDLFCETFFGFRLFKQKYNK